MELVDTHCHIQSVGASDGEAFTRALWEKAGDDDPAAVIERAQAAGVTRLICVGCNLEDSQLAVDFVKSHERCWASIGIHPHEAALYANDKTARQAFESLLGPGPQSSRADALQASGEQRTEPHLTYGKGAAEPITPQSAASTDSATGFAGRQVSTVRKIVAVGECGLDYFYEHSDKQSQRQVLEFQVQLALEHNLPVIFHVREAFDDFWPVFERYHTKDKPVRGVLHSFTDSRGNLEKALGYGLYIGVNGIATFTKKPEQQELYRHIPLDALVLETDAPFLTPVPDRGKICEPYHVRTTLEFLAVQRGEPVETIAVTTTRNARKLFGI